MSALTEAPPVDAVAVFHGWQQGYGVRPDFALYTLTRDIPGHPAGSTVSARTLAAAGVEVPATPRD